MSNKIVPSLNYYSLSVLVNQFNICILRPGKVFVFSQKWKDKFKMLYKDWNLVTALLLTLMYIKMLIILVEIVDNKR